VWQRHEAYPVYLGRDREDDPANTLEKGFLLLSESLWHWEELVANTVWAQWHMVLEPYR